MSSVTLTPQSLIVDATDKLKVDFTVGTFSLTSNFNIIMTFPARFSTTQSFFPNAISCAGSTANIASGPTCSVTNDGSNAATIKILSAYASTIASTDSASFMITNIKNPISTATITGITMKIVDTASDSFEIATRTGVTMAVTTPKTVSAFTLTFNSPSTVGVYSTANNYLEIVINPGIYSAAGCKAAVVFPSEITYQSTTLVFGMVNSMDYTSGTSTLANSLDTACSANTDQTGLIYAYIKVRGPPQVKTTSNFVFTLKTTAGDSIATGTANVPASSITTGTITTFVFTYVGSASQIVGTTTTWKIGFTIANPLANPWKITVTYPNTEFTITACTPTNGIGFTTASTT